MHFPTDVCQAARALTRVPGYAAVAVVTLAPGIGATVAIYTVLEHVVLEAMPYPALDRLVRVKSPVPGSGTDDERETSTAEYFYFREHATTVDAVEMFYAGRHAARSRRTGPRARRNGHGSAAAAAGRSGIGRAAAECGGRSAGRDFCVVCCTM